MAAGEGTEASGMSLPVGAKVQTPRGIGRVVWFFPARKRKAKEMVTVRIPGKVNALPFYTSEVRRLRG